MSSGEEYTPEERRDLLRLARASIADALLDDGSLDEALSEIRLTSRLQRERATFVTLKKKRSLRGCIGNLTPTEPLYRNVIENARRSALRG